MSDEQMRAAFEAWTLSSSVAINGRDVPIAWEAWQAAAQQYTEELALATHDRDHAERQLAKIAAENMRLRDVIQQYQPFVEAVKAVMAMYPTDWYDVRTAKRTKEPEPIAMLRQALATLEQGGVK